MGKYLPFAKWPAVDQRMWQDLIQHSGPFDDTGALANVRETSKRIYRESYGRWLEWLLVNDPTALALSPADRATLARLQAWLGAEHAIRPMSRSMYFTAALRVLRAAFPSIDWTKHLRVAQRLAQHAGRGDPARKQGKILSSRTLLEAGLRLAGLEADAATTPLARATAQRDGTMVALLAMMPLRHRAYTGLKIGESLLVAEGVLTVDLPAELTKTGVPMEARVLEPAANALRQYLTETRPFLMSRTNQHHDFVWVGNHGAPMGYSYIGKKIPEVTERLTGKRIPPHFFRDSAATTFSRESPESALMIAPLLGHSASHTAERHYIQAGSVEAGRELAKVLKRLRGKR